MRKIIVLTFITLDGVMQAPGGPEEDTSGGFEFGGWTRPYFDDFAGQVMSEQMNDKFDMLLGRKTYDIFAGYWPKEGLKEESTASIMNNAKKYVVSKSLSEVSWQNSFLIKADVVEEIKKLKSEQGPDLQVYGSSELIQTLLQNDLVDELWLKIFPLTLGKGKCLFASGTIPAAFRLLECKASPSGVIIASYARAGDVKIG